MEKEEFQRFVLLNRLSSMSVSRAPTAFPPPLLAGQELLTVLQERRDAGHAIEFFGSTESEKDPEETEEERIERCAGLNFVWLRDYSITKSGPYRYAKLLLEFIDQSKKSFSVVDTASLKGRDITGDTNERGGVSAHVVVRLPIDQHDDGEYRCVIEVAQSINRSMIESFICRQLRRWARADELSYEVQLSDKKTGKNVTREYKYTPRLELLADVGRSLATASGRELAHMTFAKRAERQSIGGKDHTLDQELLADVELKISAKQGPKNLAERLKWLANVRSHYEKMGYKTRLTYRQINGGMVTGKIHQALAGATDLVMCQKELISLTKDHRDWYPKIDAEVTSQMATFLDKNELWARAK